MYTGFRATADGPWKQGNGCWKTEFINYSAVLSTGNFAKLIKSLIKFRLYGFKQIKVKVTDGSDIRNVKYAGIIMGKSCSIRADANLAWDFEQAVEYIGVMARSGLKGIEEPLRENSIENICRLQERINVPIIVDETLASYNDGVELIKAGFKGIFNLRLSKCGGFAQCLKLYKLAEENGLVCKMGCQVGESAILSALGRHFAVLHPGPVFLEGSYGRHILREDISVEDVRFSYGGKAFPIENPGLGITIIDSGIETFCEKVYNKEL